MAASCLFIASSDLEGSAFSFTRSTHSMVFFLLITSSGLESSTFSFTSFADSWRFRLKETERVLTSYASLIHIYMLSFTSSRARSDAHQGHAGTGSHLINLLSTSLHRFQSFVYLLYPDQCRGSLALSSCVNHISPSYADINTIDPVMELSSYRSTKT